MNIEHLENTNVLKDIFDASYEMPTRFICKRLTTNWKKDFDIDLKKLWTFLNRNKKSKSYLTNLVVNGKKCVSQDDILDGWAEHFETIFKMEIYDEN